MSNQNEAKIVVERIVSDDKSTLSRVAARTEHTPWEFIGFGLELPWRDNKPSISCVPSGVYRAVFEYSPAFTMNLIELIEVQGRSECKFHAANWVRQLRGCIAIGEGVQYNYTSGEYELIRSRPAIERLHSATGVGTGQTREVDVEIRASVYQESF